VRHELSNLAQDVALLFPSVSPPSLFAASVVTVVVNTSRYL
jgi:hypothetical protein